MFHAWKANESSLSVVFHKQRFPIAPQWIPPTRTACLTPTECLEASDSAENAPAMLPCWNDGMLPSIRWVRWGGRGDELRLRGVVPGSPGTDQTLATVGGRPTSVNRHRSPVVGHSAHEVQLCSVFPPPHRPADWTVARRGCRAVPHTSRLLDADAGRQSKAAPHIQIRDVRNEDSDTRNSVPGTKQAR